MNSKEQIKENIEPLDLAQPNKPQDDQSRQITILFEYKMLQMYGPLLGVYAMPNLSNYMVWNCIIFIRRGFYKDGKFKFDMVFPSDFPISAPSITLKSSIFHPLVKEFEGSVDLQQLLTEEWNYSNENMLYTLLSKLEKMFTDRNKLECRHSYNPEASKILASKPHLFIEKALHSVELSQENLYTNESGTSLIIKKYQNGELEPYKQKLESLCQTDRAPDEKRKEFLSFLLDA